MSETLVRNRSQMPVLGTNDDGSLEFFRNGEGLWVPADASGAALVFTAPGGHWIKFGRLVIAAFVLTYPVTGNGTQASITLPFIAQNEVQNCQMGATINFTDSNLIIVPLVQSAVQQLLLFNNAGAAITNANMSGKALRATAIYKAAA